MKYLRVWISAENREQADTILNGLLDKKLVVGGQFINAPARFLWKGEIVDMDYCSINTFTKEEYKDKICQEVKKLSVEEVPMIAFSSFEGNEEFISWIDETLS